MKNSPEDSRFDVPAILAYSGLFCLVVSAVMALFILIFRHGLELPARLLLACLSITGAAAFSPFLLTGRWRERIAGRDYLFFLLILLVLLSPLLVFVVGNGLFFFYPVLAVLALFRSRDYIRGLGRSNLAFIFHGAPALAIYLLLAIESRAYAHIFLPECARLGLASLDSYFLTAVCQMVQKFGVVSTGLDGLVPLRYHAGSIYWFAALGKLGDKPPLFSYPFGVMLVLVPMLYLGLLSVSLFLAKAAKENAWKYSLIILLFLLLLDYAGANSHYVSESYTFSLILFLMSIPLLLRSAGSGNGREFRERLVLLLVLVFAMVAMKISTGVIFGIGVGYALVRAEGISLRSLFGLLLLLLAGALSIYLFSLPVGRFSELAGAGFGKHLFQYYRDLRLTAYVSFVAPLVFFCSAASRHRLYRYENLVENIRRKHVFHAELVLVLTIIAALPSLILFASDSYYFLNIAQWLALPLMFSAWQPGRAGCRGWVSRESVLLSLVLLVFIFLKFQVEPGRVEMIEPLTLDRQNIYLFLKESLMEPSVPYCGRALERFTPKIIENNPAQAARAMVNKLVKKDRKKTLVFVPPSNERFWRISGICDAVPFFSPSVLGLPMLQGLPPEGQCPTLLNFQYGYQDYGPETHSSAWSPDQLCRRALSKKFKKVLVLKDLSDAADNTILDCGAGTDVR